MENIQVDQDDYEKFFRMLAETTDVQYSRVPVVPISFRVLLTGLIIGFICGWLWGFLIAIRILERG